MTARQARLARWTSVVILAIAAFAVIALDLGLWWLVVVFALLVVLSFAFGRYEGGPEGDG